MPAPELLTPRLRLRPFTDSDAPALHRLMSGEGVLRYFPTPEPPPLERVHKTIAWFRDHWERHGYGGWAVEPRGGGELMGRCGLLHIADTAETEIDFLLGRPYWGQGFATEAAASSLAYGFREHPIGAVVGIVHPDNLASRRVLEKLGMHNTGPARYFGMDCFRYEVTRAEPVVDTQG